MAAISSVKAVPTHFGAIPKQEKYRRFPDTRRSPTEWYAESAAASLSPSWASSDLSPNTRLEKTR